METTKYYCRSSTHSSVSASSMSSVASSFIGCGENTAQFKGSNAASSSLVSKDQLSRSNKKLQMSQGTSNNMSSAGGCGSNTNGYCSSNSSGNGTYIATVPGSIGTAQHQRKKPASQEYQNRSRLHNNSTDHKCREDEYSISVGGGRLNPSSSVSSLPLQSQHQQQLQQNQFSMQSQQLHHHHHSQQQQQQSQQQHIQSAYNSTNHPHHSFNMQPHQQPSCTIDDNHSNLVLGKSCVVAATQTPHNTAFSVNCEQTNVQPSVSLGTVPLSCPPLVYTVHRVVTTAQIQTAIGNAFTSSSSVSSVVSAVRNETECSSVLSAAHNCHMNSNVASTISGFNMLDDGNCMGMNNNHLGSSSIGGTCVSSGGININSNYSTQQKYHNAEAPQHSAPKLSNNSFNIVSQSPNTTFINSSKSTLSISRPLQNVIPTCVYLMSRVAVHMEIEGTTQCPTQVMLAAALGCEELGIANKLLAQSIFGLWMTSALLEVQLKSHHRPYVIRMAWTNLLDKFSHGNPVEKKFDEPMIILKRSVFFSKRDEEKIKDHRILELLYEEAKSNVLSGRYVMESAHSLMLGGIQARIELGPYNSHTHTISYFRENQSRFLPHHVAKSTSWSWLPISRKNSAEVKLFEQFKRVPQTATTRKLMRKYLEFCWALPFYGASFFHGQVEQPVRGLLSLVNQRDVEVNIAVNERGVFIIDPVDCTLLLGLRYEDLSWDFAKPSAADDSECQTCIFIQFDAVENGIQMSKLMQVFSKQAAMIDALISHFTEQTRKRKESCTGPDQFHEEPNPIQNNGNGVLCNKLSRLTLATFDEEGRCISQMGSLSISY